MTGYYQGRKNGYKCRSCGRWTITEDRDKGVTPGMITCRATTECGGQAWSAFYRLDDELLQPPTHEWYSPDSVDDLDPDIRQHVEMGGLLLREKT